jgi:hypothetical protein
MRKILLAYIIAISACFNALCHNAPMERSANLIFKKSSQTLDVNHSGGIFAIDGHPVSFERRYKLSLPPGKHTVAYLCPGWRYVDGFPLTTQNFAAGKSYALSCSDGDVQIALKSGA